MIQTLQMKWLWLFALNIAACVSGNWSCVGQEDTNNARREEREKNLRIAMDLKRQAERATHADKEGLLQRAETFFQKVQLPLFRSASSSERLVIVTYTWSMILSGTICISLVRLSKKNIV